MHGFVKFSLEIFLHSAKKMAAADEELVTNSFFGTPYEEIEESKQILCFNMKVF